MKLVSKLLCLPLALVLVIGLLPVNASASAMSFLNLAKDQLGKRAADFGFTTDWCGHFVYWCGNRTDPDLFGSSQSKFNTGKGASYYMANNSLGVFYYFDKDRTDGKGVEKSYAGDSKFQPQYENGCYVNTSRSSFTPAVGDIILFNWNGNSTFAWSHLAIVSSVSSSTVKYIGGNQGGSGDWTTLTVAEGSISRTDARILGYVRPNWSGSSSSTWEPNSSTSLSEYLSHCTINTFICTATPKNSSVKIFTMPWTNQVNGVQYTPYSTSTGSMNVYRRIRNHVGNTWYEVDGGYVYDGDVNYVNFPDYSFSNISETNAHIDSHWISNPNQVYCQYGGAIWSTSSLANVLPKTKSEIDNSTRYNSHYEAVADTWQTRTSIENSWDFNSSFKWALEKSGDGKTTNLPQGTLQANTTYYVRLFVIDKAGNVYLSVQNSFKTSVHGGLSSWTKVDGSNHKRTCSVCSAVETQAHTWDSGSVTTAATCTATGVKTYTCTACKATKTETITKESHSAGTPQLEKTNMVTRCTVCNTIITSTTVITKDMSLEDYLSYYPSEACSGFITPVSSEFGSIYRLPSAFNVKDPETGKNVPTGDRNGKLTTTKRVIAKNVNPWGNLWYQIDDGFVYYGDVIFTDAVIELNRTSKSICVGQTFNLIATVMPEDAENKDVIWTSSNDNIVTVITDHGTIQGIATGTAVVTATSTVDPNVSAACTVTVKEHNYTYQVIKEPTLSASGTLQGICSLCSGTTTVTLPKLDTEHYSMVITKEPTMTTKGTAQYTLNDKTYGSVVISVELPCLTAFTLPRSLTRIEAEAFTNVSADIIVIPANVKTIDELAFANCPNLRYLVFQGSPTTIASNILEGCSNVTIRCISGSYVSRWAVVMGYAVEEQ